MALVMGAIAVQADIYSFYSITTNDLSGTAASIGEDQISVDVTVTSPTTASLLFYNSGPFDSAVMKICFEYTGAGAINLGLVSTSPMLWNMTNGQLPGAAGWFNSEFCIDADPPPSMNGVTPTTSPLEVILSYDAGTLDIIESLNNADFRIGMHVIGIDYPGALEAGGFSESYINNIPEPSTALLLGFIGLAGKSIRKIFVV